MALSINIANVVSVDVDGESGLFVLDPALGKVYSLSVGEVDPSLAGRVLMAARGQTRSDMFDVPRDQIAEVMKAKDRVMDANGKSTRGGD